MLQGADDLSIQVLCTVLDNTASAPSCFGSALTKLPIAARAQTECKDSGILTVLSSLHYDMIFIDYLAICEQKNPFLLATRWHILSV